MKPSNKELMKTHLRVASVSLNHGYTLIAQTVLVPYGTTPLSTLVAVVSCGTEAHDLGGDENHTSPNHSATYSQRLLTQNNVALQYKNRGRVR